MILLALIVIWAALTISWFATELVSIRAHIAARRAHHDNLVQAYVAGYQQGCRDILNELPQPAPGDLLAEYQVVLN